MILPGKYLWKAKEADMPVTVIGYMGTGADGRQYVKILESSAGVPVDELKKEKHAVNSRKPQLRRLF